MRRITSIGPSPWRSPSLCHCFSSGDPIADSHLAAPSTGRQSASRRNENEVAAPVLVTAIPNQPDSRPVRLRHAPVAKSPSERYVESASNGIPATGAAQHPEPLALLFGHWALRVGTPSRVGSDGPARLVVSPPLAGLRERRWDLPCAPTGRARMVVVKHRRHGSIIRPEPCIRIGRTTAPRYRRARRIVRTRSLAETPRLLYLGWPFSSHARSRSS